MFQSLAHIESTPHFLLQSSPGVKEVCPEHHLCALCHELSLVKAVVPRPVKANTAGNSFYRHGRPRVEYGVAPLQLVASLEVYQDGKFALGALALQHGLVNVGAERLALSVPAINNSRHSAKGCGKCHVCRDVGHG